MTVRESDPFLLSLRSPPFDPLGVSRATAPDSASNLEGAEYAATFPGRLARAVALTASGSLAGRVLSFAGNVLVARAIGVAGFGLLGIVRSTLSLGTSLTGLGVGAMASRYVPRWRKDDPARLAELLGLVALVALAAAVLASVLLHRLAPAFASDVFRKPELLLLFQAAVPWLAATILGAMATDVLRGFERFGTLAKVDVLRGALTVGTLAVVLVAWQRTVLAALLALAAVELVIAGILVGAAWREAGHAERVGLRWPRGPAVGKPLVTFALPSYGFLLLQAPLSWLLLTRLARLEDGSTFVGAVQAAGSFRNAMLLLPGALAVTLVPVLSRLHSLVDAGAFAGRVRSLIRIVWFFSIPAGALVAGTLPGLVQVAFGRDYAALAAPCALLILVAGWTVVNETLDRTLAAMGKMWLAFGFGLGYALLAVALTFLLVPRFHLWGYALGQFTAMAAYVLAQQEYLGSHVRLRPAARWRAAVLALAGGAAATGLATRPVGSIPALAAVALAGALVLAAWRHVLDATDRAFVMQRLGRWLSSPAPGELR